MKYATIFILFSGIILGGFLITESPAARVCLVYVAFSFLIYGIAYATKSPRFWQKRANGTIAPASLLVFAPLHLLNWTSLLLAVRLEKEKSFHEIMPNLWLGRRLIFDEAKFFAEKSQAAVLDLTSEFQENKHLRAKNYLCLPILDHAAPTKKQIDQALAFIDANIGIAPVFVHCALGHGRSATMVAAWMLKQSKTRSIQDVIKQIKSVRPEIKLAAEQISILEEFFPSSSPRLSE